MRASSSLALSAACAACLAWPSSARADDAESGPRMMIGATPRHVETYEEKSPNAALIGGGALMLGLSYGGAVIIAAGSDRPADDHLYVPVLGPWTNLANRGECVGVAGCGINETANKIMIAADGVFQAAGALQILGGFLFPETRTVTRTGGVHFTPTGGRGSIGVMAHGTF